ncbi:hypothetical protein DMC25_04420 [Caulobacter sp. D4A]|uniref:hypothetical protein n=1 Tax=unclassified Caulobacter TaxID=2648921 RepID=UPI000D733062|nr:MULTISPECIES: hypothetical protein [unclassified Caulobacter]PXA86120.1 hypothetical protein DMC18_22195 [Caulobacter sp. D5]PXA92790.1 hypothetical protein DMC25_04420 [Caulobacter sp. D4A]
MKRLLVALALLIAAPAPALAYTECTGPVTRIWADDAGLVWVVMNDGTVAKLLPGATSRETWLSMAMTALTTSRTITARFSGTQACGAERTDFVGMYLN